MSRVALVHVVGPEPRSRLKLRRILPGLGLAALACAAVWLVPIGLSGSAVAGSSGWRAGPLPSAYQDAVSAGQEAELPLYPCRAMIGHDVHLGRVRADFGGCHIGFDGREVEIAPFEVLGVLWGTAADKPLLAGTENAPGSEAPVDGIGLYPCRAPYQGGLHIGEARAGEKGCSFGFGGKSIQAAAGDVLQAAPWMSWTPSTPRNLPATAVAGGNESGELFYVCRAADREGLHPGKIKRRSSGCSIVSEGRELASDRFEVLVSRWQPGRAGTVPVSAVPSGREGGNPQYLCRAQTREGTQIGKVSEALGGCHVGMLGREVVVPEYEVLAQ